MNSTQDKAPANARVCPVCDAPTATPWLEKGELRLVQCAQCAMVYVPTVSPELAAGQFYDRLATPFYLSPEKLESDYSPVRFQRELRLFRQYCRRGAVLDVGCSTGGFLYQLKQRWPEDYTILGTDVAAAVLDYAESRGVPVQREGLLEADFGERRFAAITFWAVMEHLMEPKRFLRRAAALLEPRGLCFILVPNLRSLAVTLLGANYRYIMPEHVNYFSPQTLQRFAATEPAFQLIALRSSHFNPVVIWQDQRRRHAPPASTTERANLLRRTTRWKQNRWLAPLRLIYAGCEWTLGRLGWADNLVIVLRKKG